jgi:hypothetical protein
MTTFYLYWIEKSSQDQANPAATKKSEFSSSPSLARGSVGFGISRVVRIVFGAIYPNLSSPSLASVCQP